MGQAESQSRRYTPEEYFALEAQSAERHEYVDGEVFAMAGTAKAHNLIKGSLYLNLRLALDQRGCRVYDESVRLAVRDNFFIPIQT